jgi:hypothetical protein
MALLTLALSGCISLKANEVAQTIPGKITIRTVVCASNDLAKPTLPQCADANTFAGDNDNADGAKAGKGQLLVGFRVPIDVVGPGSFSTKDPAVVFTQSTSYGSELHRLFPPPADQQWIGYISAVGDYAPTKTSVLAMEPEFTLPTSVAGTFRWRTVVGFREGADAAAPVSCPQPDPNLPTHCVDSPAANRIRSDEANPVSNFGIVGGTTTTVFAGTTAVVPFKLRYADARHLGPKSFVLAARTDVPQTTARAAPPSQPANPDTTTVVAAQVPVPANTPAGRYAVTLAGGIGTPPVTRSASSTIVVEALPKQGNSPPPLVAVGSIDYSFLKVRAGRKVARMLVTKAPAKGTVAVTCRGGGCAFKAKTIKDRRTVSLAKLFRGRTLRPNAAVIVRIAGPNRIVKEITFKIHRSRKTEATKRCRPPGAKKTLSCA